MQRTLGGGAGATAARSARAVSLCAGALRGHAHSLRAAATARVHLRSVLRRRTVM
jgi:hypothetical protein